jgi:tetratricopeptide (TPR) repeat protein
MAPNNHRTAIASAQQDVDVHVRSMGPEHLDTLSAMMHLANMRRDVGEYDAAKRLQEQVLSHRKRLLGNEDYDTLRAATSLAVSLYHLGELDEARRLQEEVLVKLVRKYDLSDATMVAMDNLLRTLVGLSDLEAASSLMEGIVSGRRELKGDEDPDTLEALEFLGRSKLDVGDAMAGSAALREALDGYTRIYGRSDYRTLRVMAYLAVAAVTLGHATAATEIIDQAQNEARHCLDQRNETRMEIEQVAAVVWEQIHHQE